MIRDYVLPSLAEPDMGDGDAGRAGSFTTMRAAQTPSLVIFIDEIDYILSLPFSADELFAGIRDCFNRRSEDPRYERLAFCLLGVATPADLIRDPQTTPFNIGKRIILRDFTADEAAPLIAGLFSREEAASLNGKAAALNGTKPHERDDLDARRSGGENRDLLDRILYWTHGHPYLTQKLCQALASSAAGDTTNTTYTTNRTYTANLTPARLLTAASVDVVVAELFLSARAAEQEDNLLFVRNRLLKGSSDLRPYWTPIAGYGWAEPCSMMMPIHMSHF